MGKVVTNRCNVNRMQMNLEKKKQKKKTTRKTKKQMWFIIETFQRTERTFCFNLVRTE